MKELILHVNNIEYEVKSKTKLAEKGKIKKKDEMKEALFVAISVEKRDETNIKQVAKKAVDDLKNVADNVKTKNIMLYPYAHLLFGSESASPKYCIELLEEIKKLLEKEGFNVKRSPFGFYKAFSLKVKGHPLSELSREFGPEKAKKEETESLKKERKLTSYWYILDLNGKLHDVDKFNYKDYEKLKKFAFYEKEKSRVIKEEPTHVKLMKKLELVDYEPASDAGNLRYYPKGRLMKKLIEEYVTDRVIDYGGVEVETPIMYDTAHPTLSKYLQRFPARQYQIESDKRKFFLRFAACFGQFLMAHDAVISYKDLPLKLYELTRYSFRREQSGELTGLRRLRTFTMPDVHAIVSDLKQAMDEFKIRFNLCLSVLDDMGITNNDLEMALRTTKKFFEKNKKFIMELVKKLGKPILLEMWDERIFYFILKYEFNFVDTLDKASALSTDQIDIENGERYNIKFTDKDGKQKHPLILHCSPSGAIERIMYALLEKAAFDQKQGKVPKFPLWLSPTQVRVVPVSENFLKLANKITDELIKENIRADLDDRELHVGKKIREAEVNWCSTIIVIGEKEKKSNKLPVRIRGKKELVVMSLKQLIDYIKKETKGMPFKPLPLPKEMSKRPVFVG